METQTVDHPKWEPQVGRRLFGIHLLILHFKFQFSKSIKSLIFHIFLNLTYSLRKKYLFLKMSKNHPKIYTKPPNGSYRNKQRDLALLKTWPKYWQKGRVKLRENSLHVYPRLNVLMIKITKCPTLCLIKTMYCAYPELYLYSSHHSSPAWWKIPDVEIMKVNFHRHSICNRNYVITIHIAWIVVWIARTWKDVAYYWATSC